MDLNAGAAAYRVRQAEEEMERERKARLLEAGDTGARAEWVTMGVVKWGLVYLPIAAFVLGLVWFVLGALGWR